MLSKGPDSSILSSLTPGAQAARSCRLTLGSKKGKHIGEDLYESDGFIVHFFNKEKIIQISKGFKIEDIFELHEGSFPRKLFVVTQRKKRIWNF